MNRSRILTTGSTLNVSSDIAFSPPFRIHKNICISRVLELPFYDREQLGLVAGKPESECDPPSVDPHFVDTFDSLAHASGSRALSKKAESCKRNQCSFVKEKKELPDGR